MTTANTSASNGTISPQNNQSSAGSESTLPSALLLKATNSNDFAAARQVLADNPDQKDALLAKLSQSDAGAYYRLSNSGGDSTSQIASNPQVANAATPGAKPASDLLIAGNTKPSVVEINMGQNHKVDLIERVTGAFGRPVYSHNPDYEVARYVAKTEHHISTKSQIDGTSTLPLPNTRKGGEILAKIQTTSVGFSGTSMDGHPLLKIPVGASKEFREGYSSVMGEAGKAAFINAFVTIGGGALGAKASRPNIDMTPPRNVPTQNRSASGQERVVSPLASKSGSLTVPGTTGKGWAGKEPPQKWNTANPTTNVMINKDGSETKSNNDCGWCSLEIITGQKRETVALFTTKNRDHNTNVFDSMDLPTARKALKGMGLEPKTLGTEGENRGQVFKKMLDEPVGKRMLLDSYNTPLGRIDSNSNNGLNGHFVAAERTKDGIRIMDGQINRHFDITSLEELQNCTSLSHNTLQVVTAETFGKK